MANNNNENFDADADADDPLIPSWIVPNIFESVFHQIYPNYKCIKDFRVIKPLAAGENYATKMLRIEADIELIDGLTTTKTLMLKAAHTSPTFKEVMKIYNFFTFEESVYRDVIPGLEQMYSDVGLNVKFAPTFYELNISESHIVLEDLHQRQFKNSNRLEGLDEHHTKEVLTKMAQWHAATATHIARNGYYATDYTKGFFRVDCLGKMTQYFNNLTAFFLESVRQYDGHDEYYDDLLNIVDNIVHELYKVASNINENEFNVLNHGDFWSNNVMFQHDTEGNIRETYMVDYQMIKYGSPAQDLYYFLLSSANYEIKLKKFDYFIAYYHRQLIKYLKLLQYPKKLPTLKEIHIQLYKNGIWGVNIVIGVMAAVLLEPNKDACMDNFLGDTDDAANFKRQMYSSERYRKHAEAVLPWLYYRGLLEVS